MELDEAILGRRSCRSYEQTKHIEPGVMREIIHAGTWAPLGTNGQPWRFTVLSGHGYFDMKAYEDHLSGNMKPYAMPREKIEENIRSLRGLYPGFGP